MLDRPRLRLVQFLDNGNRRGLAADADGVLRRVVGFDTTLAAALAAAEASVPLAALVASSLGDRVPSVAELLAGGRVLSPVDHPDAAHCLVSGTGLTHLGSASARDAMHRRLEGDPERLTDSLRMFRLGLEGGKPDDGREGVQPEWFYKGDGSIVAPPGGRLARPAFAHGAGEEAEVAAVYVIDACGTPRRIGFALGNEFSDHAMERKNYLWLGHSKLRPCSIGPELALGELPAALQGTSRIWRNGSVAWSGEVLTGEANMTHWLSNIEAHHFKYASFLRPGDLHIHFLGAAALSHAEGFDAEDGDEFEIDVPWFGAPLRNSLAFDQRRDVVVVPL